MMGGRSVTGPARTTFIESSHPVIVRLGTVPIKPPHGDSGDNRPANAAPGCCGCTVVVVQTFSQAHVVLAFRPILLVVGLLLALMQRMGHAVGDRRHYY